MARESVPATVPPLEVETLHRARKARQLVVKELHSLDVPLNMAHAKARTGKAIEAGIGGRSRKEFGTESLISELINGEKVPDYLARIVGDDASCRRFAISLLKADRKVKVRTVVEVEEEEAS